jgi:hypothetical protein
VFGHKPRLAHAHHGEQHPLLRQIGISFGVAALLAIAALLLLPPHAHGNFVYWANGTTQGSIGRAKINGTGANNNFVTGLNQPSGVAVDSKFIYWSEGGTNRIGRANLDGSGVNPSFVTTGVNGPMGIAVTANSGIYWVNHDATTDTVGHANLDGSNPVGNFFDSGAVDVCGLAADQSFVYWLNTSGGPLAIGRAPLSGAGPDPNFIPVPSVGCGVAVDPSFLYWDAGNAIGRAPVGGGSSDAAFIPATAAGPDPSGVAVNSQFLFWGNIAGAPGANFIGRANINGNAPNSALIAGAGQPGGLAAAPSNKITVNSVSKNKKKGTASINTKVPGPGQVTLNQTNTPPDVNATAAGVKGVGLTITQASSFKLAVKPTGKTAKKLSKQIKKQLKKKNKAKAKASVTVFIHFVPAGVSGVPNTQQVKVTLIKQAKKKK